MIINTINKNTKEKKSNKVVLIKRSIVIFMLVLMLNLPFISALEISEVRAEDITQTTAVIKWNTDTPADSILSYGKNKTELKTLGDASPITAHELSVDQLDPSTPYYFKVSSGEVEQNNSGELFSFTTLEPDTIAPQITATIPNKIAGASLDLNGTTETYAEVEVYVNGIAKGSTTAKPGSNTTQGYFEFTHVQLSANMLNNVSLRAKDKSENSGFWNGQVYADAHKPEFNLQPIPALIGENSVPISGTSSENVSIELFVNNKSVFKTSGLSINTSASLKDGENHILLVVRDDSGWEITKEAKVVADTKPISIKATLEKGYEYYEGRSESNIHGETKPGAKVYLFIYRVTTYEPNIDFSRDARAEVTADQNGSFTFKEVNFVQLITDLSLKDLGPKEVPSELLDLSTFPLQEIADQQYSTYQIYIIAEDSSGRSAYWQNKVNVNTCYSGLDFTIDSIPQFQAPLRLVPNLLDDGRQQIQAAFKVEYQGSALPFTGENGEEQPGYRIQGVRFEKACTQSMKKSEDKSGLGCKILPTRSNVVKSTDNTKLFVTWQLSSSVDWSDKESSFWDEFKNSQVMFPLKVVIDYAEIDENNNWVPKSQTACYDLSYFVDIPIESKDMIPDVLANEGISSLNWTITQIQTVRPYIEDVYYVVGASCMLSLSLRTITRWARILTSRLEAYFSVVKEGISQGEEKGCPVNQNGLYLKSTLDEWYKLEDQSNLPDKVKAAQNDPAILKLITLDERCAKTAAMWKTETYLDQAYRWTCDRAFCRSVPAGWTADKSIKEIETVIIKQQQCAITGKGIPLVKKENCQELIRTNQLALDKYHSVQNQSSNVCWAAPGGALYVYEQDPLINPDTKKGIYYLTPVGNILGDLSPPQDRLKVYKPEGSEDYIVGRDVKCTEVCANPKKGYIAASPACREETIVNGEVTIKLDPDEYLAGYTKDCFVDEEGAAIKFYQCVCKGVDEEPQVYYSFDGSNSLRTAIANEPWSYREERKFTENGRKSGTYYPDVRYYSGRDMSGAFGADYLLDYMQGEDKREYKVDPHGQIIGTFQTLCLAGILKNLKMLESVLMGLRNCLYEAKYTGLQDAGMCKTMFTQHVCGLMYKAISYFTSSCTPENYDYVNNSGVFGDVGTVVSEGFKSMESAMQTSIDDIKTDYGNARLNEYFNAGAQGAMESMCLAAFGYEIPLFNKDFLLDAAYSFPMKSAVVVAPAWRELSSYNPSTQTAVFNYEIGGMILPGCKIKRWSVYLKCIGPEDESKPGVDTTCKGQGCDCLGSTSQTFTSDAERERLLLSGFNLLSTQMFSMPIESPLVIDSHYRYDHVVVKLELDPGEKGNEDACFDAEAREGKTATYYFPIKDVSPPGQFQCQANLVSGKYSCPEIAKEFGFGSTYLEDPFITCYNKYTGQWVSCNTPNLFVAGDEIKVQAHINSDGSSKCLRREVSGIPLQSGRRDRIIPENQPGLITVPDSLGIVTEQMFGTMSGVGSITLAAYSNQMCAPNGQVEATPPASGTYMQSGTYEFKFIKQDDLNVQLWIPQGATPLDAGYSVSSGYLTQNSLQKFTLEQINALTFELPGGYRIRRVLGNVGINDPQNNCAYTTGMWGGGGNTNIQKATITYELLERQEGAACELASVPIKTTQGKQRATSQVTIQLQETNTLHQQFLSGNYGQVEIESAKIHNMGNGDLANAVALYYHIASLVMRGQKESKLDGYSGMVNILLQSFFERNYQGQQQQPYETNVQASAEFQKIKRYLCEVDKKFGDKYWSSSEGKPIYCEYSS